MRHMLYQRLEHFVYWSTSPSVMDSYLLDRYIHKTAQL